MKNKYSKEEAQKFYNQAKHHIFNKEILQASAKIEKAYDSDPENINVIFCSLFLDLWECNWFSYKNKYKKIAYSNNNLILSDFPFCYTKDIDEKLYKRSLQQRFKKGKDFNNYPARKKKSPTDKIKIGYFSIDFRSHSGGWSLKEIIASHDRKEYEIYGIGFFPYNNSVKVENELSRCFDKFITLFKDNDRSIGIIKSLELDIFIDTTRNILASPANILSVRLAPIQISAWGYGNSSWNPKMDYFLSDRHMMPKHMEMSENILLLSSYQYCPIEEYDESIKKPLNIEENLPDNHIIYANFNAHYKLNSNIFSAWMKILSRVKNSILWLNQGSLNSKKNIIEEAKKYSINPNRIIFSSPKPRKYHLKRISLSSVILDNPFLGGGASVSDALISNTPVVTIAGNDMTSRSGVSILNALDLRKYIANDYEEYINKAVNLGQNSDERQAYKEKIKENKVHTPLFNSSRYTKELETQLQYIFERGKTDEKKHV